MAWLDADDLQEFLQAAGLIAESPATALDLSGAIGAAQGAFERRVNWHPFLKESADSTRYFDPSGLRLVDFQAGLISLTSLTLHGAAQTLNADFFLLPAQASERGLPFTYIEFARAARGSRRSIAVTGRWGRVETLPEEVRQAVLAKAACLLAPQMLALVSQGLARWREGDVEQQSGAEPFASLTRGWEATFEQTVRGYRRPSLA